MNFWQFKFRDDLWNGFEKLEVGDVFDTTVKEVKKLQNRVGDIVFWYRKDNKKGVIKGIYFVTEIISEPKFNEEYENGGSIDLRIIKVLKDNPFILEDNGFKNLVEKINAKFQGGSKYLFEEEDNGKELMRLIFQDEKYESIKEKIEIDKKDYENIEKIKEKNINGGKLFNPFLDMNLIKQEVKHLSFLTNLLNPNGTHLQGDKFLKNFIKILTEYEEQENNEYLINFDIENAKVISEKVVDKGRIDIWIESDKYIIAIEGKVEAKDGNKQLEKYNRYLQKQKKDYLLIYLTKDGEKPQNSYPKNLQLMDFINDINDFIHYSLKETLPEKIKTTLIEYQNSLITYLYELEPTWSYDLDIIDDITKDKESFQKYKKIKNLYYRDTKKYKFTVIQDIANNFDKAKAKIIRDFFANLYDRLNEKLEEKNFKFSDDFSYINLFNKDKDKDKEIMKDIDYIYKIRKEMILTDKNIKEQLKIQLVFQKEIDNNKFILLYFIYRFSFFSIGLEIYNNINNQIENIIENTNELLNANEFYLDNIENFLDDDYVNNKLNAIEEFVLSEIEKV